MKQLSLFYGLLISFLLIHACTTQKRATKLRFVSPEAGTIVRKGNSVLLKLELPDHQLPVDSVIYAVDGRTVSSARNSDSVSLLTDSLLFGSRALSAKVYKDGKERVTHSSIMLLPSTPKFYSYRVIKEYPHDPEAFTQGLEFHQGYLYESTGQYEGKSSLRRTRLETGEVLQKINLDARFFGEGLTIIDDRIIQLTWMENVGFVYDLRTFDKIGEFRYGQNKEGWGICYDGERLILSDGTNRLYFLNKDTYQEEFTVDVFDHRGPRKNLNELEFIDGKIYANVYQEDVIVVIDPRTGAIESEINLLGIYPEKDRLPYDNELNGIAYDAANDRLFVTGKNWSKLFEIELVAR